MICLCFLIPSVIAQTFIPTAELAILAGIPTIEATAESESHLVTAEKKTRLCSK